MSRLSRRTLPTVALALITFGAFTELAFAEPENCSERFNHCIRNGDKLSVVTPCSKAEQACANRNRDRGYKGEDVHGRGTQGKETNKGDKGGGKLDNNTGWNGEYTTVVVTDGQGTSTYRVKQGVEIENGQMILAPNGVRYHVWDPELGRQLKAAGVNAAYANPASAKNEYALARDKIVRDRAIAAGKPVPQPTGHRNNDALGNAAPTINDHRNGTAAEAKPGAPPAAAPGTVSNSPAPDTGPAIRDHRQQAGASGRQGGVSVTQASRSSGGSSSGSSPGGDNRKQQ